MGGVLLGQIRERTHLDSPERKKLLVGALSTEKMSLTGRISFPSSPRLPDEAENMPLFLPSHPGATLELHSHANVWRREEEEAYISLPRRRRNADFRERTSSPSPLSAGSEKKKCAKVICPLFKSRRREGSLASLRRRFPPRLHGNT